MRIWIFGDFGIRLLAKNMKTNKIDYIPNVNFSMIGISSAERDYKMAWQFVKKLCMDFYLLPNIEVEKKQEASLSLFGFDENEVKSIFSVYGNSIEGTKKSDLLLVSNRSDGHCLLEELKRFDYLFMIRSEMAHNKDEILRSISNIGDISALYEIDLGRLNAKSRLSVFELWDSLQSRL